MTTPIAAMADPLRVAIVTGSTRPRRKAAAVADVRSHLSRYGLTPWGVSSLIEVPFASCMAGNQVV
jgi:hypothetical protein